MSQAKLTPDEQVEFDEFKNLRSMTIPNPLRKKITEYIRYIYGESPKPMSAYELSQELHQIQYDMVAERAGKKTVGSLLNEILDLPGGKDFMKLYIGTTEHSH